MLGLEDLDETRTLNFDFVLIRLKRLSFAFKKIELTQIKMGQTYRNKIINLVYRNLA